MSEIISKTKELEKKEEAKRIISDTANFLRNCPAFQQGLMNSFFRTYLGGEIGQDPQESYSRIEAKGWGWDIEGALLGKSQFGPETPEVIFRAGDYYYSVSFDTHDTCYELEITRLVVDGSLDQVKLSTHNQGEIYYSSCWPEERNPNPYNKHGEPQAVAVEAFIADMKTFATQTN